MTSDASPAVKTFVYHGVPSDTDEKAKVVVNLGRTDIVRAGVQIVREGGANNLHSHSGNDGFWYVLAGKARFYGGSGEGEASVIGDFGAGDGLIIPRDIPYWFESASETPLEILHVAARDPRIPDKRTDHQPRRQRLAGESQPAADPASGSSS